MDSQIIINNQSNIIQSSVNNNNNNFIHNNIMNNNITNLMPQNFQSFNQLSEQIPSNPNNSNQIKRYIFPKKGLRNIGSTFYMNTTLQCLLHVSDLIIYFIDEFPKDQISEYK